MARASEVLLDPDLLGFLDAPQVTDSAKLDGIATLLPSFDGLVRNTVSLMTVNRDVTKFVELYRFFFELVDEYRGIARAEVITAVP